MLFPSQTCPISVHVIRWWKCSKTRPQKPLGDITVAGSIFYTVYGYGLECVCDWQVTAKHFLFQNTKMVTCSTRSNQTMKLQNNKEKWESNEELMIIMPLKVTPFPQYSHLIYYRYNISALYQNFIPALNRSLTRWHRCCFKTRLLSSKQVRSSIPLCNVGPSVIP